MTIESSYRFTSSYDIFKKCVDITKILLENKQLMLLFGCTKKVKFYLNLSKEQFSEKYSDINFEDFKHILFEEIAFIIEQNIVMPDSEETSLAEYLKEYGIDESKIEILVQEKADKRNYVQEKLILENAVFRYQFKESTMSNKLSDIKYEINKYVFPDDNEMSYAVVEFISIDKLHTENVSLFLENKKYTERSRFVCDKQDLDFIILQLQKIKERL